MADSTPIDASEMPRKRVAYVLDDEVQIGAFVCKLLRASGFDAQPFATPVALFIETKRAVPELIVLDLALGQSDAIEVIRYLETMKFRGSVLLISGRDSSVLAEIEQIGKDRGLAMLPALQKPFRVSDFKARLAAMDEPDEHPAAAKVAPKAAAADNFTIDLQEAERKGWLELWYQPKIDLKTLSVCGAEALLRARHPQLGIVSPANLLPPSGDPAHHALSRFVFRRAMADWDRFADHSIFLKLSVNVPVSVISTSEFIPLVRQLLPTVSQFPGLIIEVTEDEVIRDAAVIREISTQLKLYNAWISIDDFGAGHSSLARLIDMPCSEVKLDIQFVANCASDPLKGAVCASVVDLAHRFGASVCAEGVERTEDLLCLREMGCDSAQGFLFAKPMAPDHFVTMLTKRQLPGQLAAPARNDAPLARASS
jgi:EAL domain-containing protein (putative c-di-GMP-specific phosphodiesterase class I)/FixJ family two-component response regulator